MRIVAVADIHLDAPFAWASPSVAARLRGALRTSLSAAVDLAHSESADALLLAGDVYEHDRSGVDTANFIRRVLGECSVPVFVAPGNHDFYAPGSIWARSGWASQVHIFQEEQFRPVRLGYVTIWGAAHLKPAGTNGFFDDGFHVAGGAEEGSGLHLALFHGSERASFDVQGHDKQLHAPFAADQIRQAGLVHAIVGHYHLTRSEATHTYPGSSGFLRFGAEPGGAVVTDFDELGAVTRRWVSLGDAVAVEVELDVTGLTDASQISSACALSVEAHDGLVKLCLTGELDPDVALDEAELAHRSGRPGEVIVDTRKLRIGYDLTQIASEDSVRGEFVRRVNSSVGLSDAEQRQILTTGLRALAGRSDLALI